MDQELLAQLAALAGAVGSVLVLVAASRLVFLGGLVLLAAAGAGLAGALRDGTALDRALSAPGIAAGLAGLLVLTAGALVLVRRPGGIIPVLVAVAPFRPPVDVGGDNRFLVSIATDGRIGRLLPLYAVLAAAALATAIRVARERRVSALPRELAYPAAAFVALVAASLTWSHDVPAGTNLLLYFVLPAALLVAVTARAPVRPWLARVLFVEVVAITGAFAAIGLWQAYAKELFFSTPKVEVGNVYSDFFRVTSLFNDPSLYGRHLVVGIAVVLVAMWARKLSLALAAALIGLLWAGLFFSYSQSSMVALVVTAVAVVVAMGDRTARRVVVGALAVVLLVAGTAVAATVKDESIGKITSDRSRRVDLTAELFVRHPIVGVGVGAHPRATAEIAPEGRRREDFVSHTTPLTVAAEQGILGVAAYVVLLCGAAMLLYRVRRVNEALGVGLAAVLLALFVHSLFYGGFFEDPVTWLVLGIGAAVLVSAAPPPEDLELW
jgi:hypothetical protein